MKKRKRNNQTYITSNRTAPATRKEVLNNHTQSNALALFPESARELVDFRAYELPQALEAKLWALA